MDWPLVCRIFGAIILVGSVQGAAIVGFNLASGASNVYTLSNTTSATVTYTYSSGNVATAEGQFDFDNNAVNKVSGDISVANTITFTISGTTLANIPISFGTYLLSITVTDDVNGVYNSEVVIFYEESISNLQLTIANSDIGISTTHEITAQMATGSNIDLEWFLDATTTCLEVYSGAVRTASRNISYSQPGEVNVTVIAANEVNSLSSTLTLMVVHPIQGYSIGVDDDLQNPYYSTAFSVMLDVNAPQPTGNINLEANFGDGHVENHILTGEIAIMQSTGHIIHHIYTSQGNFTASFRIYSAINEIVLQQNVYVWEPVISYLSFLSPYVQPSEAISMDFAALITPKFKFKYRLEYGDGTEVVVTDQNMYATNYSSVPWTKSYSNVGTYELLLTAWNEFYFSVSNYTIYVQNAIPSDLELAPLSKTVSIPDGYVNFTISMPNNVPAPSDVSCDINFGDTSITQAFNIVYGTPVHIEHNYTSNINTTVTFFCSNLVSNITLSASVIAQVFQLSSLVIQFPNVVGMNSSSRIDNDKYYGVPFPVREDDPVTVTFQALVFAGANPDTPFPSDLYITWIFDGSAEPKVLLDINTASKTHEYFTRGTKTVAAIFERLQETLNYASQTITIGAFSGPQSEGALTLSTQFTFTIPAYQTYTLYFGDGQNSSAASPILHSYNMYGIYHPYLIASDGSLTEIVYSETAVVADYTLNDLSISFSNTTIGFPPGSFYVNISVGNPNTILPNVICDINLRSGLYNQGKPFVHNISYGDPLFANLTYDVLGIWLAAVNCSNFVESKTFTANVSVWNECFTKDGIFDRQYLYPETPLLVYTSVDFTLASRMGVKCYQYETNYDWKIESVSKQPLTYSQSSFSFPSTAKGSVMFKKGQIAPGLYRIELTVSLVDSYVQEETFIEFKRPSPFCFIKGGNERNLMRTILTIDGYSESYDAELGGGYRDTVNFTLACMRLNVSTHEDLYQTYKATGNAVMLSDAGCGNAFTPQSTGVMQLDASSLNYGGYVVLMKCETKAADPSYFVQTISMLDGNPPSIVTQCTVNCREKAAINIKTCYNASCEDCTDIERNSASYAWTIDEYNETAEVAIPIPGLTTKVLTSFSDKSFCVAPDTFIEGRTYRLTVNVDVPGRSGSGKSSVMILANTRPYFYDGDCNLTPDTGYYTNTTYVIQCTGAHDEGSRHTRDPAVDSREPIVFEYILHTKSNISGQIKTFSSKLYQGSQGSASVRLPVGQAFNNYEVNVSVNLKDRYGDSIINDSPYTQVLPDPATVPTNGNDTAAVSAFMDSFNGTLNVLKAGGDPLAVVQFLGSTSLALASIKVEEGPVSDAVSSIIGDFVNQLNSAIPDPASGETLTVDQVASLQDSLMMMVSNPAYVSTNTTVLAVDSTLKLTNNLLELTNQVPFPVENWEDADKSCENSVQLLSDSLQYLLPLKTVSLEEITYESIRSELEKKWSYNETEVSEEEQLRREEEVQALFQERTSDKHAMIEKEQNKEAVQAVVESVSTILKVQAAFVQVGEEPRVLQTDVMTIKAVKAELGSLVNGSYDVGKDIYLDFSNSTDPTQVFAIKTAVFDKPLEFYGTDAYTISSKSVLLEATDESGNEIKPDINVKITNEQAASFSYHQPQYKKDDTYQMLYFKYESLYNDDATLMYIYFPNFEPADFSSFGLFTVYTKMGTYPTPYDYDFKYQMNIRDWESDEYGFKVFVPQQYTRSGDGYIALHPIEAPKLPPRRRLLAVDNDTFEVANVNFSSIIMTTGCRTYDKAANAWVAKGCTVLGISTINETVCRCPDAPGKTIATTFYVPLNTINFNTVWSKFDPSNAAVYGTLIAIMVIYVIVCIWAHRQDRRDFIRWATHFLCDSDNEDTYFYLITVHTGLRRGAGTKSLVHFVIAGEETDSGVRILSDGVREGFETGSVIKFFMGTSEPLGNLTYMRIWHDSSGKGDNKSWYLHKVLIDDLQTKERHVFMCDNWLAAEMGDGMVERLLPVCGKENLMVFEKLFSQHARFNITENHLWLSLVMRPQHSTFTRVQRLTCLLALLCLTMISNAMYFKSGEDARPDSVQIGGLRFSLTTVYISFVGILITTPPILLMTVLFKKSKPKPRTIKLQNASDKQEKGMVNVFQDNVALDQQKMFKDVDFFKTDHLPLPHWVAYIAWVVAVLAVLASSFFLILYSMEWGKPKSEEWLTTFVLSFLESLIMVDPVKVLVLALLLALLFKKPVDGSGPQVDLEKVQEAASKFNAGSSRSYLALRMDVLSANGPPPGDVIEKVRKQRQQEIRARRVLIELIAYAIFAFVIYSLSYINRDQRSFFFKDHIVKALVTNTSSQFGFDAVKNTDDFFFWCNNTLFRQTFPDTHYNGDPLGARDKQYFFDLANTKIGPPRFRMVRMVQGGCPYGDIDKNHECIPDYNEFKEADDDYCVGWTPKDDSSTDCSSSYWFTQLSWNYIKSSEIWGIPITGRYNTYGGGGYIMKLENSIAPSLRQDMLDELRTLKWINRETRAVFVEFTLYNPNTNLFAYCVFLSEFTDTGGLLTWTDINVFRPYQTVGGLGTYALICYLLYLGCLIFTTAKIIAKIKEERCKFLASLWNIVDSACVIISFGGIVMFAYRYHFAKKAMKIYYDDLSKEKFINFQHVVIWDIAFNISLALLVFVATIRILRVLGYNKRMTQLAAVLAKASTDLTGFGVVFGIVFFAYMSLGYLMFGPHLYQYRDLFSSFGTLTNGLIGKNSLDDLLRAVPNFSQFFYFTYVFLVLFILMTVFSVVLNQSITEVRKDLSQVPESYGITNLFGSSFQSLMSFAFKSKQNCDDNKRFSTPSNKEFLPVAGKKRPEIDTPNILRIVRDTFGEDWHKNESLMQSETGQKLHQKMQQFEGGDNTPQNPFYFKLKKAGSGSKPRKDSEGDLFRLTVETPRIDTANHSTYM